MIEPGDMSARNDVCGWLKSKGIRISREHVNVVSGVIQIYATPTNLLRIEGEVTRRDTVRPYVMETKERAEDARAYLLRLKKEGRSAPITRTYSYFGARK
ncbi:hypothetical protein EBT31_06195 [bacterium]|nr:hypothetical protein [bacterium]